MKKTTVIMFLIVLFSSSAFAQTSSFSFKYEELMNCLKCKEKVDMLGGYCVKPNPESTVCAYLGLPPKEIKLACDTSADCKPAQACVNGKCVDQEFLPGADAFLKAEDELNNGLIASGIITGVLGAGAAGFLIMYDHNLSDWQVNRPLPPGTEDKQGGKYPFAWQKTTGYVLLTAAGVSTIWLICELIDEATD